jgi:glutamyl-tRNA synthetase
MDSALSVRFAPSPTGYLHVGGARTAIFNYLLVQSRGGNFHLRIEDTDKQRSSEEMTAEILHGLQWLGIEWHDEVWHQSTRAERHREEAMRLLSEGKAYYCYLTQEELTSKRKAAEAAGEVFWYGRAGLVDLSADERSEREAKGFAKTLRFLVPDGETTFNDMVHDDVRFGNKEIDDFIILRSDGSPVYMMSVVVDDHDMGVTHVLRGDDHLSNTPKQILLYEALGYDVPQFGHVPLILGQDKKRLSKRHGATSVSEYEARGFLPEAMFNYLALLGWSPGEDREIMTLHELTEAFDPARFQKSSAVFDEQKLEWMNGSYIRAMKIEELVLRVKAYCPDKYVEIEDEYLAAVLALMQERMTHLTDVFEKAPYFFEDPVSYDEKGVSKHWKSEIVRELPGLITAITDSGFTAAELEEIIRTKAEAMGIGAGKLIHPMRLALTGQTFTPGIFETMVLLGHDKCVGRLQRAIEHLGIE